ncbi:imidazole glycerol phosphate synthase subunit HisH [Candidatus Peregrinibacteria bacterium]|nr:imidazole glycerol phosphate synthase subunit HisH [Candidatus Peregrinibacteria bacterium]
MIAIIDYGAGNLKSVCNALEKLGQRYKVVFKPQELRSAKKVILPGVGAAGNAMEMLSKSGFKKSIPRLKIPFLGICLGMQLLADFSEEDDVPCLSIIPGQVKKFLSRALKVPQIGWNKVKFVKSSPLTEKIRNESYFYFVNSYYFDSPRKNVIGKTNYGLPFASIIQKNNFYAVQFHPEKSGPIGLQLLRNFCKLC